MTRAKIENIVLSNNQYYKDLGWSDDDIDITKLFIVNLIKTFYILNIPIKNDKFPEVLRGLANILDLMNKDG